jgi:ABC-type Zn2+ transport system substrate-binding protein/surface adhesin
MRISDAKRLKRGDTVLWVDPDGGACTKLVTVAVVAVRGDMVQLTDRDSGDYIECFAGELEFDR